jgi:uroporphyrinogen-III synthase
VTVGGSTAEAARDLGLVPHAVSSSGDDAAVFEALVWAMACAAAEEGR